MKTVRKIIFLCGAALIMLAAFPVRAQEDSRINKKPLLDFAADFINRYENGEIDLNQNFLVDLEGELNKDGKFDLQKTRYVRSDGDEKIVDVVKSAIEATNNTGIFYCFYSFGANKVNLILSQNDSNIYAAMNIDFDTPNKAKTAASLFNAVLSETKKQQKSRENTLFLNGTAISSEDKTVTIKTSIEKSAGQELIKRWLDEEIVRRKKTKNG